MPYRAVTLSARLAMCHWVPLMFGLLTLGSMVDQYVATLLRLRHYHIGFLNSVCHGQCLNPANWLLQDEIDYRRSLRYSLVYAHVHKGVQTYSSQSDGLPEMDKNNWGDTQWVTCTRCLNPNVSLHRLTHFDN